MRAFSDPSSGAYARAAGFFYLCTAVAAVFSIIYVPSQIVADGDAGATMANIRGKIGLRHMGIAADLLVMTLEIMLAAMLYFIFREVSRTLSFAAAMSRIVLVSVMAAMLFFHAGADLLAHSDQVMTHFSREQRADIAGFLLALHRAGVWIWQIFFTMHLLLLGYLIIRSHRFPSALGYGLSVGAMGYLLDSVHAFAFPEAGWLGSMANALLAVVSASEVAFALWLFIRAPKAPVCVKVGPLVMK